MSLSLKHLTLALTMAGHLVSLGGCTLNQVDTDPELAVPIPEQFSQTGGTSAAEERWWQSFDNQSLNELMNIALTDNLTLKQAWARLVQAQAQAQVAGARRFPQLNANFNASESDLQFPSIATQQTSPTLAGRQESYSLSGILSYEVDLWGKLRARYDGAKSLAQASREEVKAAALSLSGQVFEAWLRAIEQKSLLERIDQQRQTGKILLKLTETRFGQGLGSALDVLQQQQQVAATEAERPPAESALAVSIHQLAVLLGRPPGVPSATVLETTLPKLPPLPSLPSPASLLLTRPDLRASYFQLLAADYELGAAIAERLPQLELSLSYTFSARNLSSLFEEELRRIAGSLLAPLFDAGQRRAAVARQEAVVQERLLGFSQRFLTVLAEVENALVQEAKQKELLARLHTQLNIGRANLSKSQLRYVNGLNDYLPVLNAVQSLHQLERRIISEQRLLLSFRAQLYRSLGGTWTNKVLPPAFSTDGT